MTSNQKTIILAGATGAVGKQVLAQALAHPKVKQVVALTRKPLQPQPKLVNAVVNFDHIEESADWWKADALICALGTTIKIAGTPEAFRKVDLEMPAKLAKLAAANGVDCYVLNSSMMANENASGLYLKTKGEAEKAVRESGIPSVVIARPGLLDAQREERRFGEEVGIFFSRIANPVLPKKFRSVPVAKLAKAMLEQALEAPRGIKIMESAEFQ